MDTTVAPFKIRLNQAMKSMGVGVNELARMSGVDRGSISKYRNGKALPGEENLRKLQSALGVSLFDEEEVNQEIAALIARLPKERQQWYRDLAMYDLARLQDFIQDNELAATLGVPLTA